MLGEMVNFSTEALRLVQSKSLKNLWFQSHSLSLLKVVGKIRKQILNEHLPNIKKPHFCGFQAIDRFLMILFLMHIRLKRNDQFGQSLLVVFKNGLSLTPADFFPALYHGPDKVCPISSLYVKV